MQLLDAKKLAAGTPVLLGPAAAEQVRAHIYATTAPKYAFVESAEPFRFGPNPTDQISVRYLRGKTILQKTLYVPADSFQVQPLEDKKLKRMESIQHRNTIRKIGELASYVPTLGSDPEVFLCNKTTKELIPAFEVLPKKGRETPRFSLGLDENFSRTVESSGAATDIFWDGFQGEFGISSGGCIAWFCDSIHLGLKEMRAKARARNPEADFLAESVVMVSPEVMAKVRDDHAALGCSTSHNVYGTPPINVVKPRELPFRFAGGHLHFGDLWLRPKENRNYPTYQETIDTCVKTLDATVGVASVLWFKGLENPVRRQFYGRAGEYRLPTHGLEYRTLGNAWMYHPAWTHLTLEFARRSLGLIKNKYLRYWTFDSTEVRDIIDNYDYDGATKFITKHKWLFRSMFDAIHSATVPLLALEQGLAEFAQEPKNISHNWLLDGDRGFHSEGGWGVHSNSGYDNCYWSSAAGTIRAGKKI